MPTGTKAKAAFSAIFSADGRAIFSHGQRKVRKEALQDHPGKSPRLIGLRSVGVTHSSSVALTHDQTRLLVTDTSGGLHALDSATGAFLWRSEPLGESNRGIVLPDGSFLLATWKGLIVRIDPVDGAELWRSLPTDHLVHGASYSSAWGSVFYRGVIPPTDPHSPPTCTLRRMDLGDGASSVLRAASPHEMIAASPDGQSLASRSITDGLDPKSRRSAAWIEDPVSGRILVQQTFAYGTAYERALCWPDARYICHGDGDGFWFLNAADLSPGAFVPWAYAADVTFSPDRTLVFLSGWEGSLLLRAADLAAFPVPVM